MTTAFVLGGGGLLGAHEVGMLRALSEAGIRPDLVVGTSIGALNGAFVAADPSGAAARLGQMWEGDELRQVFSENLWGRAARLVRSGTHLHSLEPLQRVLEEALPGKDFADLRLPFQCVAAGIETASGYWFSSGPLVPAVLASCAVPGLLPPVEIDGTHYFDGGLVDSIPVGRAVALGATSVYVLQVGRIESPLEVPTRPWEVGLVAFEIARRHRFHEEMVSLPSGVSVHILPTGGDRLPPGLSQFRYRHRAKVGQSIERAYAASVSYLGALARQLSGLLATGGPIAPTQAGPPAGTGADGDRHRARGHRAVAPPGPARVAVRPGGAVARGPDAEPAAAVVRRGLAHRRDRRAVYLAGPVDHQRVRRPDADRTVSKSPLRGHPAVPGRAVPGSRTDVRSARRGRGTGAHGRRAGCAAGPAGHRPQPTRGTRRFVPARASAAERLRTAAASGHEGCAAIRPQPGRGRKPPAQRVHPEPQDRREHLHRADRAAGPRPGSDRGAGDLPGGRQLDTGPLAPRYPAAGARWARRPGRARQGHAQPAPAAARRDAGRHRRLPRRRRDLRGPRGAGHDPHRGRHLAEISGRPGAAGQVVAGAVRSGAACGRP